MGRTQDLERAERAIKDAEIRLNTISTQLNLLEMDVAKFSHIKNVLESNITSLKKKKVIALAEQYRKAKNDLAKANAYLNVSENNRNAMVRIKEEATANLEKYKREYEELVDKFENNVIYGNFGGVKSG